MPNELRSKFVVEFFKAVGLGRQRLDVNLARVIFQICPSNAHDFELFWLLVTVWIAHQTYSDVAESAGFAGVAFFAADFFAGAFLAAVFFAGAFFAAVFFAVLALRGAAFFGVVVRTAADGGVVSWERFASFGAVRAAVAAAPAAVLAVAAAFFALSVAAFTAEPATSAAWPERLVSCASRRWT